MLMAMLSHYPFAARYQFRAWSQVLQNYHSKGVIVRFAGCLDSFVLPKYGETAVVQPTFRFRGTCAGGSSEPLMSDID